MRPRTLGVLEDIRDAIGYIVDDTAGMTFEEFAANRQARQLVAHNFEIIGEAVNRLRRDDSAIVEAISNPSQYVALRNVLIHRYDVIDYLIIWTTVQKHLPILDREVRALLHRGAL